MAAKTVRIQKFLAECGVASRRAAEKLIVAGKVRVNDRIVKELGAKIDPERDRVFVKNKPVVRPHRGLALFNKPRSVVSTLSDPEGRPCISDYLTKHFRSYYPVGRLDWETSGLIVLTNDGELAQHMMHPRYECRRVYHARVEGAPSEATFEKGARGVRLVDGPATAELSLISNDGDSAWIEVVVTEGRNRLVRRLLEKLGHPVMKLKRIAYGPFKLGKLQPGEMRRLTEKEYEIMRAKVMGAKSKTNHKSSKAAPQHGSMRDDLSTDQPYASSLDRSKGDSAGGNQISSPRYGVRSKPRGKLGMKRRRRRPSRKRGFDS